MASSSSSGTRVGNYRRGRPAFRGIPKKCYCGEGTVLRTSTTPKNPGRLFHVCPFRSEEDQSHLFKWTDESIVEEVEDIRVGLQIVAGDVARSSRIGNSTFSGSIHSDLNLETLQTGLLELSREVENVRGIVAQYETQIQAAHEELSKMKRYIVLGIAFGIACYVLLP